MKKIDRIEKSLEVDIKKIDSNTKTIEGVVYRPSKVFDKGKKPIDYVDAHGDWMTEEDVKRACHRFSKRVASVNGAVIDSQHNEVAGYGTLVENYISKADIPEEDILKGDWVAAIEITCDDTWGKILKKEITGFSIGGKAVKYDVEE